LYVIFYTVNPIDTNGDANKILDTKEVPH
jgi:hypothetical protein